MSSLHLFFSFCNITPLASSSPNTMATKSLEAALEGTLGELFSCYKRCNSSSSAGEKPTDECGARLTSQRQSGGPKGGISGELYVRLLAHLERQRRTCLVTRAFSGGPFIFNLTHSFIQKIFTARRDDGNSGEYNRPKISAPKVLMLKWGKRKQNGNRN